MKLQFVDVETTTEYGVNFGTCELCEHVGDLDVTHVILRDADTGVLHRVEAGYWDYGDYFHANLPENLLGFAGWLNEQEFPDDLWMSTQFLRDAINEFEEFNNETGTYNF